MRSLSSRWGSPNSRHFSRGRPASWMALTAVRCAPDRNRRISISAALLSPAASQTSPIQALGAYRADDLEREVVGSDGPASGRVISPTQSRARRQRWAVFG